MSARLYLFCGNDTYASFTALQKWRQAFSKKYGEVTRFVIEADELNPEAIKKEIDQYLQAESLFRTAKLLVIKRITVQDKGRSFSSSKTLVEALEAKISVIDELVTVVVWVERYLEENHPLKVAFKKWSQADIKEFISPTDRQVNTLISSLAKTFEVDLNAEAAIWLKNQYVLIYQREKQIQKLKYGQVLPKDERGWWVQSLMQRASFIDGVISRQDLQDLSMAVGESVSPFQIIEALVSRHFLEARRLTYLLHQNKVDSSFYFSLYALLRSQSFKMGSHSTYLLQLLAEIELISKNYPLEGNWLLERLIRCMEEGGGKSLLHPRKLWLSQLQRSG